MCARISLFNEEGYSFFISRKEEEYELKNICGPNLGPQISKSRVLPYAITEQGVAMLATVLHTKIADEISMRIIDDFYI